MPGRSAQRANSWIPQNAGEIGEIDVQWDVAEQDGAAIEHEAHAGDASKQRASIGTVAAERAVTIETHPREGTISIIDLSPSQQVKRRG